MWLSRTSAASLQGIYVAVQDIWKCHTADSVQHVLHIIQQQLKQLKQLQLQRMQPKGCRTILTDG